MTRSNNLAETQTTAEPLLSVVEMTHQHKQAVLTLSTVLNNAAKVISPVWPLKQFIACNPLQGLEELPFEQALESAYVRTDASNAELELVNVQLIKWCSAYFDEGQSSIAMPGRDQGFYKAFIKLAPYDSQLHQKNKQSQRFLRQLPECVEDALVQCLTRLNVTADRWQDFLAQTLSHLPGWAGYVKWKEHWQQSEEFKHNPATLMDFVTVRLVLTCLMWPDAGQAKLPAANHKAITATLSKLKANEECFEKELLQRLSVQRIEIPEKKQRKSAQLVFCIDVRSEPFRRAIESQGNYETYGFAGFFGLPIRVNKQGTEERRACCPVLLSPQMNILQTPTGNEKTLQRQTFLRYTKNLYTQLKHNFSTPFALVESFGLLCGASMLLKSISPRLARKPVALFKRFLNLSLPATLAYESELTLEAQIIYAENALRLMGLTSGFAKYVIFCGHKSTTENNPYASALDCGACGGNSGEVNARLLADMLNNPQVRIGLEDAGMHIPLDTMFYGALHDTTTDNVSLFTEQAAAPIYPDLLATLKQDLQQAQYRANMERARNLSPELPVNHLIDKSFDWSETRPEWGLARNAAFIVGSRHLTEQLDLQGRCFLHSYDWHQDQRGEALETILTAPMVVAQWINTQYLFSTLNNVAFGSGSKVTHNVVGKTGIMQGNGSDLMHGLPLQSVMACDREAYHVPQRLLVVVHAPKALVSSVIARQEVLQKLFYNEWVHLRVIDSLEQKIYRLDAKTKSFVLFVNDC